MTVQHSDRIRNAAAALVTSTIAAASTTVSAVVQLRTGAQAANCSAPAAGTLLGTATISGIGYMAAPSGGQALQNTALTGSYTVDGTVGHYRIVSGDGLCDEQGSVSLLGGGGDMQLSVASLAVVVGQPISITGRTLVGANP